MTLTLVARDQRRLEEAAEELRALPGAGEVRTVAADLSEPHATERAAAEADAQRPIDFACHAAGLSTRGRIVDTSREEHERLMAINFFAAAELASALGERLSDRKGRLVLIGSLATRVAPAFLGAYPTSKHPLAALAQQLRMELGPHGLRTLLVCPGPIARADAGARYDTAAEGLPDAARQPGGGAKVAAIDPTHLAERILQASRRGQADLVVPAKSRLLFALTQLAPAWGDWLLRKNTGRD